jgi:Protein kinase domain
VAVKVFQLDLPPERMHRLVAELEALVAAGLAHPAIATPLATGTDGTVAYLAQDYLPSDSIDVLMRDQRLVAAGDALRVAEHLAGALDVAAAHKVHHGVLHPRDVLVSRDDSIDDTRLTGLGVARAIEKAGVTPPLRRPYAAPERIAGGAWDQRADVFSLAALVHEMLWGRRLAAVGSEAAGALTELPGCDLAVLRAAFARALAPKPADRFETAHEFAAALRKAFPGVSLTDSRSPVVGRQSTAAARLPLDDPPLRSGLEGRPLEGLAVEDALQSFPIAEVAGPVDGAATERGADLKLRTASDPGTDALGELELRAAETVQREGRNAAPALVTKDLLDIVTNPEPATVSTAARTVQLQETVQSEEMPLLRPESAGLRPAAGVMGMFGRYEGDPPKGPADRAAFWPVAAALMVGIALGFGGGYTFGGRHVAPAPHRLQLQLP